MRPEHYRDLVVRAAAEPGGQLMNLIVAHMTDAEKAKQILRAKGYGVTGTSISATAAQVPSNRGAA
jgi:hypothetical protein